MAVAFKGIANFQNFPASNAPDTLVGDWHAYEINNHYGRLDYSNHAQEIIEWAFETFGAYKVDWWAYESISMCVMIYLRTDDAVVFKLRWG